MVVWRVDYDEELWTSNTPNDSENDPHLTVSRAYNTWGVVYDKPVTDIRETNGVVTFKYKGGVKPGDTNEDIEIVESPESRGKSQKILHNGQIFIIRDGKRYDILGKKVQ